MIKSVEKIINGQNVQIIENLRDFNLDHIFDCGQCFRWKKEEDGSYSGIAKGRKVNMAFQYEEGSDNQGTLTITGGEKGDFQNIWKDYLDLHRDYGEIKKTLSQSDPVMAKAIASGRGIRILKQDLWETIVSFIISQNNNIPRIKSCIENLGTTFGEDGNLPTAQRLSKLTVEDLAPIKLGYRAKYLIETSKQVESNGLPTNKEELGKLTGVGPKVANCISLFGMQELSSFPIDVWMKRVMSALYGFKESDVTGMAAYAQEHFGQLGGIAQQYLFYYIRQNPVDI